MNLSSVTSIIERRLLVNYRVDPDIVASLLPVPLRPQRVAGWAVAGICLIRLGQLRPSWLPGWLGTRSENAAHRIAVEWDGADGRQVGVYIPRRDSDSLLNTVVGGRLFPGRHHRASFDVSETAQDLHVAFASADGTTSVSVDVRTANELLGSALFADMRKASDFFLQGSTGFSAASEPRMLDGVRLHADRWMVEPAEVHAVRSSFFDDTRRFPQGSAIFDSALLMRDIPATWSAITPMRVSEVQPARSA